MNLQEQISRIQEMMGFINESDLPINIRRRLNTSREENMHHLKDYVMRYYQPDKKEKTISRAFFEESHRLLNQIEQDENDYWDEEIVSEVKKSLEDLGIEFDSVDMSDVVGKIYPIPAETTRRARRGYIS